QRRRPVRVTRVAPVRKRFAHPLRRACLDRLHDRGPARRRRSPHCRRTSARARSHARRPALVVLPRRVRALRRVSVVADAARILLGFVFLASGVLKVRNRDWPPLARQFGTPGWLVPVLPWAELAIGALLVADIAPPWMALVALVVLLLFTA